MNPTRSSGAMTSRRCSVSAAKPCAAARYIVKENGCTQDGRFLLVKFEDAVAA